MCKCAGLCQIPVWIFHIKSEVRKCRMQSATKKRTLSRMSLSTLVHGSQFHGELQQRWKVTVLLPPFFPFSRHSPSTCIPQTQWVFMTPMATSGSGLKTTSMGLQASRLTSSTTTSLRPVLMDAIPWYRWDMSVPDIWFTPNFQASKEVSYSRVGHSSTLFVMWPDLWNPALASILMKFLNLFFILYPITSGNRTPGSRFYSDLLDTSVSIHQLVLKRCSSALQALGCSHNCRRLTYGSFQLTYMSRDDHAVQLIETWRPKRRQNITTTLTTLPQGWISAHKHQCTTAIKTMWTQSSWTFPESYTGDDSWIVRSSDGGNGETKRLITPKLRWVSAQLLYVCVTAR